MPASHRETSFITYHTIISGVTILLSLTVFAQVVADLMPATSDAIPLLGKCDGYSHGKTNFVYVKPTFQCLYQKTEFNQH